MDSSNSISPIKHSAIDSLSVIRVACAMYRLGTTNSVDIIASCPYTRWKGVFLCNLLVVVLYAYNTVRKISSQSYLFAEKTFVKSFSRILLKASMVPFDCGRYRLFLWCWMRNYFVSISIVELRKCLPWSLVRLCVHSNLVRIFSLKEKLE
uniref:Uncharacterized protein n=1 Tax=Picea glauca TaxID=3330 RepID=A0A101M147_PICGL|nr:hypothetical protein ABT39_MTgene4324 [Picea glauca]